MLSSSSSLQTSVHVSHRTVKFELPEQKMSLFQQQMKKHYENLEKRALDNYKRDREIQDHLNDWKYCNPENNQDQLPQPYRLIDNIIREDVIKFVLVEIGEIEKKKLDPSYDGQLKLIHPSGDVSMPTGITAIAEAQGNPSKHLFLGDRFGNIFILDQNKKYVVTKFDQLPRKRILHISACHQRLVDSHVITIVVAQRAHNKVSILRYVEGDNQITPQYNITVSQVTKTAGVSASDFVYESQLSLNSQYLALHHYSGSVSVYSIPEPPLQKYQVQVDQESQVFSRNDESESMASFNRSNQSSPRNDKYSHTSYKLNTQKDIPEIKPYYVIEFKGKKRDKKYSEIMKEVQKDNDILRSSLLGISLEEMYAQIQSSKQQNQQPPPQEKPQPAANQKKDVKKPAGKDDKKEEALKQQQLLLEQQSKQAPDFLKNKEVLFGQDIFDQNLGDISEDVNIPFYKPNLTFLNEKITFSNKDKQFNKPFVSEIASGLVITWYNSKNFQYHKLNESVFSSLPQQIQYRFTKTEVFQSPSSTFKPHMTNNFSLIYSITCMEVNPSQKYIGFGLKDGNIIIWDNQYQVEKKTLQYHTSSITCVRFFHEKFAVTGCNNGQVIIHSLEKEESYTQLSNTYSILKNNPILNIQINKYGLVQVLDSKQNVRTFNIHLGTKVARLEPKLSFEKHAANQDQENLNLLDKKLKYSTNWIIHPKPLFHLSQDGDQLYILNEEIDNEHLETLPEDQKLITSKSQQKNGILQIFKLADNLSVIFEGIKNLFRNGVEKDKILFQFTQMKQLDLDNKDYQINQPSQLGTEILNTQSTSKQNSTIMQRFSRLNASRYSMKNTKSQTQLKLNDIEANHNKSINISSIKGSFLPSLNKLKEQIISPKSETSSFYSASARKSLAIKNLSQMQGLTEQKLHPEKYLWQSQYLSTQTFDPLNNSLAQARERVSRQHLLEQSISKSMMKLEKTLKTQEDERMQKIELEKKRYLKESIQESIGDKQNKKKKNKTIQN